jgi:hypothetical protein
MNPYLEHPDVWSDFHQSFIPRLREMLVEQVGEKYMVKIEEHLFIHEFEESERRPAGRGDVTVAGRGESFETASAGTLAAPVYGTIPVAVDIERHGYLEIRDRKHRQLVTVIELLSPSNKKPGADREQYLAKRDQLLFSQSHLIEVDLLRAGPRMPVDDLPTCDYCVLVSRCEERPRVGIWPLGLRDPLPMIPIPLRDPDPDAGLDLQSALHHVYDSAGYANHIYSNPPEPPLAENDAAWAGQLAGAGR